MPSPLQETMDTIANTYTFTQEHYPSLKEKSPEEIFLFAIRHNALHMGKALGKISAFSEDTDHGEVGNRIALREGTLKMFINVLRIAELQGITADDLLSEVPKMLR